MENKVNIYVVVPAYNEENTISDVITNLKNNNYKNIIVIDDGSTDSTYKIAKENKTIVIKHPINLGAGAAVKTGTDYALSIGADIIIIFDADGQHMAKDINNLIKPIINKEVDVTLGSRFLDKKSNVPLLKKIILKGGIVLVFLMYGILLTDAHNGLKALSRKAAERIIINARGWEYCSEIIEEIKIKKIKYKEIPVTIKYSSYSIKKGQKIYNSLNIFLKMIKKWLIE